MTGPQQQPRLAVVVSEVFAPGILAAALPLAVGAATAGWPGLGWGAAAIVFTAVIPLTIILTGVRLGRLTSHHIDRREQRAIPLALSVLSVLIGFVLLTALNAPAAVRAAVAVLGAGLAATTVVNLRWKLSGHASTAAGVAVALTAVWGWAGALSWLIVGVLCWARLRLEAHTALQVAAGCVTGAALALPVWLAIAA